MIMEMQTRGAYQYSAGFGPGGSASAYRYTLRRSWFELPFNPEDLRTQHALFIMLNPSTADAFKDDPTVAKCMRLAARWGFGAVEVRNIFALRSTDPKGLRAQGVEPTGGQENDLAIITALNDQHTGLVVAAWGNHGTYLDRASSINALLEKCCGRPVRAFAITKEQQPAHPLYQREGGIDTLVRYL